MFITWQARYGRPTLGRVTLAWAVKLPVEAPRSAGIEETNPQEVFSSQNILIDNELDAGRGQARIWAIAPERRSRYALMKITSKAAWAMSGCGLPRSGLLFHQIRSGSSLSHCVAGAARF